MTKINQEEYEILKGLDDKWKWIARDENGEVWVYKSKPSKLEKEWDSGVLTSFNNNTLLQFIQWEDENPYNIAELVKGYGNKGFHNKNLGIWVGLDNLQHADNDTSKLVTEESGEKEVKKDIEWLKGRLRMRKLFKPQTEEEIGYNKAIDEFSEYVDQLDEPEVLSQDWIVDNVSFIQAGRGYVLGSRLQNLLVPKQEEITEEQALRKIVEKYPLTPNDIPWILDRYVANVLVEQPKKPVIPSYVAEWIDTNKEKYDLVQLFWEIGEGGLVNLDVDRWIEENPNTFASAWLNGFTVEEEPLYRARLKVITDEFIASYLRTQSSDAEDRLKALEIGSKYINEDYRHLSEFTEDELKKLDIWDSEQWEVEEVK